ncbi:hypothetical protein [Agromyces sp. Soil535]|uniref:hypothetical protein n=1 Tax=Agromyces sp. Soil535 TaxID=1736390 RepID=UPI0012E3BB01|nr:hypothetical protein [Agromyces sp. Soil535]
MALKRSANPERELARVKLDIARWKRSRAARDAFQRGWRGGYGLGRSDERDRIPDRQPHVGFDGHPQVELYGIEVDEGLAPLLDVLWRLGLDTQYSCQGHPDHYLPNHPSSWEAATQIFFTDVDQALKFVKKSMELLGPHAAYHEGGFRISVASGIDSPVLRGDVRFSPTLIEPLLSSWTTFEAELAARASAHSG